MMTRATMTAVFVATTLLGGCIDTQGDGSMALLEAPPDGEGVQLSLHAPAMDPGATTTFCHYVVLPEAGGEGIDVSAVEHRLAEGAQEVRLLHTDLTLEDVLAQPTRFSCDGTAEADATAADARLTYAGLEAEGALDLPSGVALHFASREVVLLVARYANEGQAVEASEARLNLWYATDLVRERTATVVSAAGHVCGDPSGEGC